MASELSSVQSIHDFTVKDGKGNDVELSKYKGKVLLIVNVASQWYVIDLSMMSINDVNVLCTTGHMFDFRSTFGLTTSNYTELAELYQKYKDQGLEILAFPCNQFNGQEPGTNEEIENFVCTRFKAEYPIFSKVDVNGSDAAPLYKYLKSVKGDEIEWNFAKFLVDKDGKLVERYAPTTTPLTFENDIKKVLGVA
ncbi:putative phospholipid hydroperoxide glutathione peroxidase isoform X1 [Apium graveolens]|uniref:putative phospholipid hydroperoxide glutathione peroxidase isoform X1 n=1 Tax=Apium graveolens TaxID=4045 RepID=UPI003D7BE965